MNIMDTEKDPENSKQDTMDTKQDTEKDSKNSKQNAVKSEKDNKVMTVTAVR